MVSRSALIGFHGCDKSVADQVVSGHQDLRASTNEWDWLGHGIYFWEDSYARALHWAEEESQRAHGKVRVPAVVGAIIHVGNCLNLIEAEALRLVQAAYEGYRE